MTQPSFADELRAAATALRTAADAAQAASPLPWTAGDDEGPPIPYIALMHPGVGHALAQWLDIAAADADLWPTEHEATTIFHAQAVMVARALNGAPQ